MKIRFRLLVAQANFVIFAKDRIDDDAVLFFLQAVKKALPAVEAFFWLVQVDKSHFRPLAALWLLTCGFKKGLSEALAPEWSR